MMRAANDNPKISYETESQENHPDRLGERDLLSIFAYLILGKEWARLPFSLSLCLVCLYNLFFNNPGSGAKEE